MNFNVCEGCGISYMNCECGLNSDPADYEEWEDNIKAR